MRNHLILGAVGALFLTASALAVTGGRGISQQGTFLQSGTGATLRTIESKLRDTVSVKDYGCVGDGVVDDTTCITNAITQAGSGALVWFPCPGSYKTTTYSGTGGAFTFSCGQMFYATGGGGEYRPIQLKLADIKSSEDFTGSDVGAQINAAIAALPTAGGQVLVPAETHSFSTPIVLNRNNVWLKGMQRGTDLHWTGGAGTYAITLGNANPSTIRDLWVTDLNLSCDNSGGKGIRVRNGVSVNTNIARNTISYCATQIEWGEGSSGSSPFDGTIRDNSIVSTGSQIGIDFVYGGHSVTVDSNWIRDFNNVANTTIGLRVQGATTGLRIVNNNIEGHPGGNIILDTSNGVNLQTYIGHNYLEPWTAAGLDIDLRGTTNGTTIDSNYMTGVVTPSNYAIKIASTVTNTAIIYNTFANYATAGVNNLLSATPYTLVTLGNNLQNATPALLSSSNGLHFAPLTDSASWRFEVNSSVSADVLAKFVNSNGGGYGVSIRNGIDTNYALSIQNAAANANNINLFGNGAADFAGGVTVARLVISATAFASLGTPSDGTVSYCNDCVVAATCAGSGSGAIAQRIGGAWTCNANTWAGPSLTGAVSVSTGTSATTLTSTAATTRAGLRNANTRNITRNSSVAAVDCAGGALNATVTQLLDGAIFTCATAQTLTLPTWQGASGIVQALPGAPAVGDVIQFVVNSTAAANFTLAGGTGGTVVGNAVTNNAGRVWTCRLTNVGAGTEAASCY